MLLIIPCGGNPLGGEPCNEWSTGIKDELAVRGLLPRLARLSKLSLSAMASGVLGRASPAATSDSPCMP